MSAETPFFSVIVPSYNRPRQLRDCLGALAGLDYPKDRYEVIVVDDGSDPPLAPVVERFRGSGLGVTSLAQPNSGPAAARNTGAGRARGAWLAFTDDDCQPARDWLTCLEARARTVRDHVIGGRAVNGLPENFCSSASQLITDAVYDYYNQAGRPHFFASNNMAVPAAKFRQLGGFDTSYPRAAGEDREFCRRWLAQGHAMSYAPEAVVRHAHELNLTGFCRQHFNYGRAARHLRRLRSGGDGQAIAFDPKFYEHLLLYPFRTLPFRIAMPMAVLIVVQQASRMAGFIWDSLRGSRPAGGRPSE